MHDKAQFRIENDPSTYATTSWLKVFGFPGILTPGNPSKYEMVKESEREIPSLQIFSFQENSP